MWRWGVNILVIGAIEHSVNHSGLRIREHTHLVTWSFTLPLHGAPKTFVSPEPWLRTVERNIVSG
jgi:hypothetical protein